MNREKRLLSAQCTVINFPDYLNGKKSRLLKLIKVHYKRLHLIELKLCGQTREMFRIENI